MALSVQVSAGSNEYKGNHFDEKRGFMAGR
jgi:hypothetical protein